MTEAIDTSRSAPWHFWVVAAIAVLWNGFGGYDYTMSHLQGETYYRQMGMTDGQIALMAAFPGWMHAVWAIGVWGSVAGSLLLLLRMRWAMHAFALSTLGAVGSLTYNLVTPGAAAVMSPVMPAIIVVICLFFVWYAWTMTKRGVLR
ncbi:MAG: hypothetical protein EPO51_18590 [Phenylobacterium sp.]|uniref:hypothetical protein n=1 Tax=Phenylobacterium sp. TaxID=1871053 RepID=UPI001209DC8E|nr:hypothetical protein [Phenylobacterium sp.]TAJ70527.1 MAG: hypothetical protein EPO51_18590 [Phenylobacterium sp.]